MSLTPPLYTLYALIKDILARQQPSTSASSVNITGSVGSVGSVRSITGMNESSIQAQKPRIPKIPDTMSFGSSTPSSVGVNQV